MILFLGIALVVIAIVLDAIAYKRLSTGARKSIGKGVFLSIVAGISMGFFYRFVADAWPPILSILKRARARTGSSPRCFSFSSLGLA